MKTTLFLTTTAAALAFACSVSAQTLPVPSVPTVRPPVAPPVAPRVPQVPQIGGQVGGQVGAGVSGAVRTPQPGSVVGTAQGVVNDGRGVAESTVRDARSAASTPRADVSANANGSAGLRVNRDRAAVDSAIEGGVMVRSSDGVTLGSIAQITRNAAGRATSFLVRSSDGALRLVPTGNVGVQGDALVTGWSQSQFMARPLRRNASTGSDRPNNAQRDAAPARRSGGAEPERAPES